MATMPGARELLAPRWLLAAAMLAALAATTLLPDRHRPSLADLLAALVFGAGAGLLLVVQPVIERGGRRDRHLRSVLVALSLLLIAAPAILPLRLEGA
jgi:hypothetical protein